MDGRIYAEYIDKETNQAFGFYLAYERLIEKYARQGYTIYLESDDGTVEKITDPITEEEGGDQG